MEAVLVEPEVQEEAPVVESTPEIVEPEISEPVVEEPLTPEVEVVIESIPEAPEVVEE